jgi:hydrogenase maturation factor
LPASLLASLLAQAPIADSRVRLGPGIGRDCAIIELEGGLLALKTDPITFATDALGWYLVQINANDIATTGATPRWLLVTLLLTGGKATEAMVEDIMGQVYDACRQLDISVVGGHTEITHGIDRPIAVGALIGEVAPDRLVTPEGARVGDRLLLTKGVPVEATAILAREFPDRLREQLDEASLSAAQAFLTDPGISVLRDAQIAMAAGTVTAMHDPTEGGLLTALWELAEASDRRLVIDLERVPVLPIGAVVCDVFGLNPLGAIASGALLLTVPEPETSAVRAALEDAGISCTVIGRVVEGLPGAFRRVVGAHEPLPRPERDEIARVFEGSR